MRGSANPTGLSYYLPESQRPHTFLHIPESHTVYVGPSACTRRHAFHALKYGDYKDVSFLFVSEVDIISGDYENMVGDAIEDLLTILSPTPRIFILAVFCIDDFLGTDEQALLDSLSERFPNQIFAMDHIDPVTLGEDVNNGMMRRHLNMFSFLRREDVKDRGINFLGNYVSLDPGCELLSFFRSWGIGPVRELFNCKTYNEYRDMAKSCLAIGLRFVGASTQNYMTQTLGIPYYYFPTSYDVDVISAGYAKIASLLGCTLPDISRDAAKALADARQTALALNQIPIAIDSGAFIMTFSAALALLRYGFNVRYIFRGKMTFEQDIQAQEEIKAFPDVKVFWEDDYASLELAGQEERCLAIGEDSHRLLQTKWFADVWHDEGYFGFQGIHRLMSTIRDSMER